MVHKITTPITDNILEQLKVGDKILLTGVIYTARDAAHKKMISDYEKTGSFPFDLEGQVIYYVGPSPAPEGEVIGSCGPTTSYRMDQFHNFFAERGVKMTIGKGFRNKEVIEGIKNNKCIYALAIGGTAAYLQQFVKSAKIIAYPELLSEAVRELYVEDFPCYVAIDTVGNKANI